MKGSSWDNEPMSSLTHFIAMLFSILGLVLLILAANSNGTVWHVVTFSIFGSLLILLYLASAAYHFVPCSSKFKKLMQKIDHAMIYILIAGTYTPVCLTVIRGGWGWSIFGVIWGLATLGSIIKLGEIKISSLFSVLFYIGMGWLALIAIVPLKESLPAGGIFWLFVGGLLYTLGTIFFALDHIVPRNKWLGMHEVFHLFVMAGSFSHFWLMFKYVLYV